jgi:Fur family peroxide stress response transcriptional regulator
MKSNLRVLNQRIRQQGYRMTRQREIVLDELSKTREHPKADEIYQMVRKKLPHISFGTVYRNLRLLKELGLVRELSYGKNFSRYEAFFENHQHFTCQVCGRVMDIDEPLAVSTSGVAVGGRKMDVDDFRIEFYGTCADCM